MYEKKSSEYDYKRRKEPLIGDGLLKPDQEAPPNFHPNLASGHLFSASQSLRSDLSDDELNSRRDILIKPKLKTGNLSQQSSN